MMVGIWHADNPATLWLTADHLVLARSRPRSLGGNRDWSSVPSHHFERSRELRKESSPAERTLWSALRMNGVGVKFRRQHPIGPYIADFYSREAHLVVEVDGSSHFSPEAFEYDGERDAYMRALGLDVMRFTTLEVEQNLHGVCLAIQNHCRIRTESMEDAQWIQAGALQPGDLIFSGPECRPVPIETIETVYTDETVYDLEIEGAHSFITEVCAVHNCGSGTTAYVAEQWGRRWITVDVSRVALAIARQRLLTARFDYYRLRPTSAEDVERNPDGPWLTDPAGQIQGSCTLDCKTVPHITLRSIAQNPALDPIFEKWEPVLAEKLTALNRALAGTVTNGLRRKLTLKLTEKTRREGRRSITEADRRRWQLPEKKWEEWEVPFDVDPDWPEALQGALTEYRRAWRRKMDEVNACIAARADQEEMVDQPFVEKGRVRVSGPFTMEGIIPAEESIDEEEPEESPIVGAPERLETFGEEEGPIETEAQNAEAYLDRMTRLLREDGVRFPDNKVMRFKALAALSDGSILHAKGAWGEGQDERQVAFGPQYGPMTAIMVEDGIRVAARRGFDDLAFAAFGFDGAAQAAIQEDPDPKLRIHMAQIRPDVTMGDLLKTTVSSQLFTVSGSPRTRVELVEDGQYVVRMEGVDIYDPVSNAVRSTGAEKVAAWFLDSDYDGRCFCVCQAFFPDRSAWDRLGRALGGALDEDAFAKLSGTVSLPFPSGEHKRIAVKVIDPRGNEVLRVHRLGKARE